MRQRFTDDLRRFAPVAAHILAISLLIGLAALGPTLYNMAVYNQIIMAGSVSVLWPFLLGAVLAFGVELSLRAIRSRQLAYFGARLDHVISHRVFRKFLSLPSAMTERASVSAQVARLRDFESVRDFFTGALAPLLFEMPLVAVYLAVMALLSPVLALVPLGLVAAYGVLIAASFGRFRETGAAASLAGAKRQEFVLETVSKLRELRLDGMEEAWRRRYAVLSDDSARLSERAALQAQNLETVSYALMTLGATATLTVGVTAVIDQSLSVGALVASMILIWRVVSPLQVCCASMTRLQQLAATMGQIKRVVDLPPESEAEPGAHKIPSLRGEIEFYRVGLRYAAESEPALLGVSFRIKAGQIVAVRGANGSGKSTLLKTIMGLYTPQSGCVRIDGMDIRQRDPSALRDAIAYVPQSAHFFPGTIRDNLLLAAPQATEEGLREALEMACAADEVDALSHGLDTVLAGENAQAVPFLLKQRLNLARAYLRPAAILLFDEASHSLGAENDRAFRRNLERWRGKKTIVMVTHRDDHARLADQIFVLDRGELVHVGVPDRSLTRRKEAGHDR